MTVSVICMDEEISRLTFLEYLLIELKKDYVIRGIYDFNKHCCENPYSYGRAVQIKEEIQYLKMESAQKPKKRI